MTSAGPRVWSPQRVVAEPGDGHAPVRRAGDDLIFGMAGEQFGDRVQPGRDPGDADAWGVPGERRR